MLNDDHYGLDKVKERILEYLAVQRTGKMKGRSYAWLDRRVSARLRSGNRSRVPRDVSSYA